nr:uncharacterized protein LOC110077753 [Pogona vitticeps]
MNDIVPLQENIRSATSSGSQVPFPEDFLSSFQESSPFTEYSQCFPKLHNSKCCSPSYSQNISCTASPNLMGPSVVYEGGISSFQDNNKVDRQHHLSFPKTMETGRRVHLSLTQNSIDTPISICCGAPMPQLGYDQNGSNTYLEKCGQSRMCLSKAATGQNLRMPVFLKNAVRQAAKDVHGVKKQRDSDLDFKQPWYFVSNKDVPYQQCSSSFLGEFGRGTPGSPEFQFEESFRDGHLFTQARDSSSCAPNFCGAASNPDIFFNLDFRTGEYTGKKGLSLLPSKPREQDAPAEFTQIPQLKKRRLTFEKDPGRSDGQTRLKFF